MRNFRSKRFITAIRKRDLFINKGYAVFKQINILCKSDEYYIVEEGNDYGLSNYDHIALDGKSVQDNDIVFE